ncbi:hypothetical protein B0T19DRAFT_15568 [Cercophora scortea]|uniref:Uncharacterized protein n=1 Tax=Cercophora scortea TaxID=314031 RepID=A0AAE0ML47_9PEZI|nr:hypothetical protein B0T19DRAFT_15568 [Cercophora scortea]
MTLKKHLERPAVGSDRIRQGRRLHCTTRLRLPVFRNAVSSLTLPAFDVSDRRHTSIRRTVQKPATPSNHSPHLVIEPVSSRANKQALLGVDEQAPPAKTTTALCLSVRLRQHVLPVQTEQLSSDTILLSLKSSQFSRAASTFASQRGSITFHRPCSLDRLVIGRRRALAQEGPVAFHEPCLRDSKRHGTLDLQLRSRHPMETRTSLSGLTAYHLADLLTQALTGHRLPVYLSSPVRCSYGTDSIFPKRSFSHLLQ